MTGDTSILTVIFGFLLAAGQLYIGYRLRQQDNARDAARAEAAAASERVAAAARAVADKQENAIAEVHVIVNSKMTDALARVAELERKMGLVPGEQIPAAAVVTRTEEAIVEDPHPPTTEVAALDALPDTTSPAW